VGDAIGVREARREGQALGAQGHLSEALRSPFARAPTRCRAPSRDSRTLKARRHRSSGRPGYWQWLGGAQRIGVDP
jgi:hypothetical protein